MLYLQLLCILIKLGIDEYPEMKDLVVQIQVKDILPDCEL